MTFTLIVGAAPALGAQDFYKALLARAEHVVAADAASEWCVGLGRMPDVAVGDFDGSRPGAPERLRAAGVEVVRHPADKDATDLDLAVALALQRFGSPLVLTAAFTSRLDHTLAALGTLVRAGADASACEPSWTVHVCRPGRVLRVATHARDLVSIVAPAGAGRVSATGVRWPLRDAPLDAMSGLGVSNEALGDTVEIEVGEGTLLVFVGPQPG
jgi:thiamine pyrophosphokinase